VADLTPLAGLTALTSLGLTWCEAVTDLTPVAGLTALREVHLDGCSALRSFAPLRAVLGGLNKLCCCKCRFEDLPAQVCGESFDENVVDVVRAYYADLDQGALTDAEVKLFVLGNAGVGKTQLSRRLCGQDYDESIPSTHGVRIGHFTVERSVNLPPARVNLWDFGGQDIYHGSHALFLEGHAVFLVLWHPDSEQGAYEEDGVPLRHRPLTYWLDYVRSLAPKDAPVLLIQSKCDERGDRRKLPTIDLDGMAVRTLEVSARTGRGLDKLREEVR
jgi:internalin A